MALGKRKAKLHLVLSLFNLSKSGSKPEIIQHEYRPIHVPNKAKNGAKLLGVIILISRETPFDNLIHQVSLKLLSLDFPVSR